VKISGFTIMDCPDIAIAINYYDGKPCSGINLSNDGAGIGFFSKDSVISST